MLGYSELITIPTFEDRMEYLRLDALPGDMTFGLLRKLNQKFYASRIWKLVRTQVIARDLGFDLGVPGYDIWGRVIVHHINPITPKEIYHSSDSILDLENLITVSNHTHLAIHFGSRPKGPSIIERVEGDTKLW